MSSSIDEEIANRLKALKNEVGSTKTDKPKTNIITITSTKSNEEEVRQLIRQLTEETEIDSKHQKKSCDIDTEIQNRLEKLKCFETSSKNIPDFKEETVGEIVAKYSSLAELENKSGGLTHEEEKFETSDELPWCVICNEDGMVRCLGCDKDIYCSQCYFDFHDKEDLTSHPTEQFKK